MTNEFKAGDSVCYKTHPDICIGSVSPDIDLGGIYMCINGEDIRQIPIYISDNWSSFFGHGSCLNTMNIDEKRLMLYENTVSEITKDEIEQYTLFKDKFIKACRKYCNIMHFYDTDYMFLDTFDIIDNTVYASGYTSWNDKNINRDFPVEYLLMSSDELTKHVKSLIDSRNIKIMVDLMNTDKTAYTNVTENIDYNFSGKSI